MDHQKVKRPTECGWHTLRVGMQNDATTLKNSWSVPQMTQQRGTYDPAIALLGIYLKELKTGSQF